LRKIHEKNYLLERFLAVLNLSNHLHDIQNHFESEYPREGCGVIAVSKGKSSWIPCENIAEDDEDFKFSSKEYLTIRRTYDIIAIIHSHPDASAKPSDHDKNVCNALGIPYYIFSYPNMDLEIYTPEDYKKPLIGREYQFGFSDCFEAAKDWYEENGYSIGFRDSYEDDWWHKGLDYFTEDAILERGFVPTDIPEKGCLLLFKVEAPVANHCGVYLGNDIFFHHADKRLSCRENLYPFWIKHLVGIYKHETNCLF
jgi:proteasome lid subunit RPN8/RPN11